MDWSYRTCINPDFMYLDQIRDQFKSLFGQEPLLVQSPGRINVIGEHTDYNEGWVLPAAIDKYMVLAIAPNGSNGHSRFFSWDQKEYIEINLPVLEPQPQRGWINHLLGVVYELEQMGAKIPGFNLVFGGDIPIGAGLSSSAALECALALGLNELFHLGFDRIDLVKASQLAEHHFVGVQCGIMDMFASMMGQRDKALRLDCRTLETQLIPLELGDYQLLLCDTGVKHALASSEYNTRRQECETGVRCMQILDPDVRSLRDASLSLLQSCKDQLPEVVYRRCRYVLEENRRLQAACNAMEQDNLAALGELLYQSHHGLQHDYEVSCPELDWLVDQTRRHEAILGARMMGGGFGGCTLNLIRKDFTETFVAGILKPYQEQFNLQLKSYVVTTGQGTHLIDRGDY